MVIQDVSVDLRMLATCWWAPLDSTDLAIVGAADGLASTITLWNSVRRVQVGRTTVLTDLAPASWLFEFGVATGPAGPDLSGSFPCVVFLTQGASMTATVAYLDGRTQQLRTGIAQPIQFSSDRPGQCTGLDNLAGTAAGRTFSLAYLLADDPGAIAVANYSIPHVVNPGQPLEPSDVVISQSAIPIGIHCESEPGAPLTGLRMCNYDRLRFALAYRSPNAIYLRSFGTSLDGNWMLAGPTYSAETHLAADPANSPKGARMRCGLAPAQPGMLFAVYYVAAAQEVRISICKDAANSDLVTPLQIVATATVATGVGDDAQVGICSLGGDACAVAYASGGTGSLCRAQFSSGALIVQAVSDTYPAAYMPEHDLHLTGLKSGVVTVLRRVNDNAQYSLLFARFS